MTCPACSEDLHDSDTRLGVHRGCVHPVAEQVRTELQALIQWASDYSPRSLQASPGPSELGDPCDRRLAYRLAGAPKVNTRRDPLAAFVGTGLHSQLEQAILTFNQVTGDDTFVPETRLQIDPTTRGTSDLYHRQLRAVVDWKSASTDVINKAKVEGPPPGYRVQAHLYGYGYENTGLEVEWVVIAYIPRSGLLRGIHVWADRYDPQVAVAALRRRDDIGGRLTQLGSHPQRFAEIEAAPSPGSCWFCPYKGDDMLPSAHPTLGCPGR